MREGEGVVLKGAASGQNVAEIVERAARAASEFFGTSCVRVEILTAEIVAVRHVPGGTATMFTADYVSWIEHRVVSRAYGPAMCDVCNTDSWPQNPLQFSRPEASHE